MAPQLTSGVLVIGCTLAKMVLDAELRKTPFDVVILDEASMALTLYALAASFLATQHLVYAGDPKQLPPIVQADGWNAARWFGQNIYDWLGVAMGDETNRLRLLQTQYRMTNEIGGVVSRLIMSMKSTLKAARQEIADVFEEMGQQMEAMSLDRGQS